MFWRKRQVGLHHLYYFSWQGSAVLFQVVCLGVFCLRFLPDSSCRVIFGLIVICQSETTYFCHNSVYFHLQDLTAQTSFLLQNAATFDFCSLPLLKCHCCRNSFLDEQIFRRTWRWNYELRVELKRCVLSRHFVLIS